MTPAPPLRPAVPSIRLPRQKRNRDPRTWRRLVVPRAITDGPCRFPSSSTALTSDTHSRKSGNASIHAVERLWNNAQTQGDKNARYTQRRQFARGSSPPVMDCARLVEVGRSRVAVSGSAAFVACLMVMVPLVFLSHKASAVSAGAAFPQPDTSNLAWVWQALSGHRAVWCADLCVHQSLGGLRRQARANTSRGVAGL